VVDSTLLDDLIAIHGEGALLNVKQYVLEDRVGDDFRWIVLIDGHDVPELEVRHEPDPELPGLFVMSLVRGNEELPLIRWSHEHGQLLETLAHLKRRLDQGRV